MPQPLRAVIFDLDGILADSEPWWNEIDSKLLAEYGVIYRGEYHREVLGVSYRLAVEFYKKALGLSASVEELMRRRGEIATEFFADRVGLFPSARATLGELRQLKVQLAVGTRSVSASALRNEFLCCSARLCRPALTQYSCSRQIYMMH